MQIRRMLFSVLIVGCGVLHASFNNVEARPLYKTVFQKKYYEKYFKSKRKQMNCLICHDRKNDGKPNLKKRNNYGQAVRKLIGKKNEKDRTKVDAGLQKTEKEPSAIRGKTFGDLIKAGILPAFGWRGQDDYRNRTKPKADYVFTK